MGQTLSTDIKNEFEAFRVHEVEAAQRSARRAAEQAQALLQEVHRLNAQEEEGAAAAQTSWWREGRHHPFRPAAEDPQQEVQRVQRRLERALARADAWVENGVTEELPMLNGGCLEAVRRCLPLMVSHKMPPCCSAKLAGRGIAGLEENSKIVVPAVAQAAASAELTAIDEEGRQPSAEKKEKASKGEAPLLEREEAEVAGKEKQASPPSAGYCVFWGEVGRYEGSCRAGVWHGLVVVRYAGGGAYYGEARGGRRHGFGVLCNACRGAGYWEGQWRDGRKHGWGVSHRARGRGRVLGQWRDGKLHGQAIEHTASGARHESWWVAGRRAPRAEYRAWSRARGGSFDLSAQEEQDGQPGAAAAEETPGWAARNGTSPAPAPPVELASWANPGPPGQRQAALALFEM